MGTYQKLRSKAHSQGMSISELLNGFLSTSTDTSTLQGQVDFLHTLEPISDSKTGNRHIENESNEERPNLDPLNQINTRGRWSSGYDIAFTRRWSPVRIRVGPPIS